MTSCYPDHPPTLSPSRRRLQKSMCGRAIDLRGDQCHAMHCGAADCSRNGAGDNGLNLKFHPPLAAFGESGISNCRISKKLINVRTRGCPCSIGNGPSDCSSSSWYGVAMIVRLVGQNCWEDHSFIHEHMLIFVWAYESSTRCAEAQAWDLPKHFAPRAWCGIA